MHHDGSHNFLGRGWRHAPGCVGRGCGADCRFYFEDEPVTNEDLKVYLQELEQEIKSVKKVLGEKKSGRGSAK